MKIAVLGLGSIGRRHLGNFHAVGVDALSAYDVSPAQRAAARTLFPFATITDSPDAAVAGCDGVAVCTPPDAHLELGRLALAAGAHVMIEKPLTVAVEGVADFLRECDRKGRRVLTAYNWRYWPPLQLAERLIREGRLGAIRAARTEYAYHLDAHRYPGSYRTSYMADAKQGGGCLLDESHAIDYMRWLCGEIVEVSAVVEHVSGLDITTDDLADLTVRFASGAVGNIHMNLFAWNVHTHFELLGERGVLQWRRMEGEVRLLDPASGRWEVYPSGGQLNDMYVEEARHFLACVRGEAAPRCDGWDGLKTMQVIEAARRSAAERRWVRVEGR